MFNPLLAIGEGRVDIGAATELHTEQNLHWVAQLLRQIDYCCVKADDPQRNLQEILTPHGHWIKFTYDDQTRITRVEDDGGKWVKYGYNSYGMLIYTQSIPQARSG